MQPKKSDNAQCPMPNAHRRVWFALLWSALEGSARGGGICTGVISQGDGLHGGVISQGRRGKVCTGAVFTRDNLHGWGSALVRTARWPVCLWSARGAGGPRCCWSARGDMLEGWSVLRDFGRRSVQRRYR
jgi:hypothetical protein